MPKITDVRILVERRPGKLEPAIKAYLAKGWDWSGRVELSSTDGFVTVFTQSEEEKPAKATRAPRKPKAEKVITIADDVTVEDKTTAQPA